MNNEKQVFAYVLKCDNPNAVFETLKRVILSDDYIDDRKKIQRLIDLMHAYKGGI